MNYIGITMGCPVGIGPEIILRFFASDTDRSRYKPVVLGDRLRLQHTAEQLGIPLKIVSWKPGEQAESDVVPVFDLCRSDSRGLVWGRPDGMTGKAMALYVEEAVRLIREKTLLGLVTCPISKKALHEAGYSYPGHTEMLADLTGSAGFGMMMAGSRLKVILVTIHEPLAKIPVLLNTEKIVSCIDLAGRSLTRDFNIRDPKIAVAGLNPHAGEAGMFGLEEETIIAPAVRACQDRWRLTGPCPPDTVFHRAAAGEFDAVIAMYHDQGLIPFKLLHFSDGVNVTVGLPIVRTSVDHGTAYDIAGKGIADPSSLIAAWNMAAEIVDNRYGR